MRKITHDNKAIVFTLDAAFALLAALAIITTVYFYLSESGESGSFHLSALSQDTLSVLEADSILSSAVADISSSIELFLSSLPMQVCAKITLFTSLQSHLFTSVRPGCIESGESIVTRRVFLVNYTAYLAEAQFWYNSTISKVSE